MLRLKNDSSHSIAIDSSSYVRTLLLVLSISTIISLSIAATLKIYFDYPVENVISYFANDSPAPLPTNVEITTVGQHYFGDYLWAHLNSRAPNLTESGFNSTPWPPATYLLLSPLSQFPYLVGLILFLLMILISCVFPFAHSLKSSTFTANERVMAVLFFAVLTAPVFISIDRGNAVGLLPAVIYQYFVALEQGNRTKTITYLVLATVIKPHAVVFIIPLLAQRRFRRVLASFVSIAFVQFLGFLFSGGDLLTGFHSILRASASLEDSSPSFIFQGVLNCVVGIPWIFGFRDAHFEEMALNMNFFIVVSIITIISCSIFRAKRSAFLEYSLLSCCAFGLVLPYSPPYSYVCTLVPIALLIRRSKMESGVSFAQREECVSRFPILTVCLFLSLLVPLPIPYRGFASVRYPVSVFLIVLLAIKCLWAPRSTSIPKRMLSRTGIVLCGLGVSMVFAGLISNDMNNIDRRTFESNGSTVLVGEFTDACSFSSSKIRRVHYELLSKVSLYKDYQDLFQTDELNFGMRVEISKIGELSLQSMGADGSHVGVVLGTVSSGRPFKVAIQANSTSDVRGRLDSGSWRSMPFNVLPSCRRFAVGTGFDVDRSVVGSVSLSIQISEVDESAQIIRRIGAKLLLIGLLLMTLNGVVFRILTTLSSSFKPNASLVKE